MLILGLGKNLFQCLNIDRRRSQPVGFTRLYAACIRSLLSRVLYRGELARQVEHGKQRLRYRSRALLDLADSFPKRARPQCKLLPIRFP